MRDELVAQFLPNIRRHAQSMSRRVPSHIPLEDLVSAGALGLLEAARRYDPSKCEHFEVYAEHRIRGAILDELRSHDNLSRDMRYRSRECDKAILKLERQQGYRPASDEVARELGLSIAEYEKLRSKVHRGKILSVEALGAAGTGAEYIEDGSVPDSFSVVAAREVQTILTRAIDSLPDRLKVVVGLYYQEELKLSEIGAALGVTEARACQLRGEAVRKIREILCSWNVSREEC
jgi:RNA polymerase sigma factor for flagellar operon FliA